MDRRTFLKDATGAIAGGAALGGPIAAQSQSPSDSREASDSLVTDRCGADCMVDVIKGLGLEYLCANPGSSFRALHEALVNYGGNTRPELLTCCHEESSVAMAHGFAKIDGRPIGVMAHGTVGLQHAAMAIYNAYCDRVPVYIIVGNTLDATERRPGVEWAHSVQDAAALVRDFSKWDDTPISLEHFAESAVRAYKLAMTPPMGPVLLVADSELQERPLRADFKLRVPKLTLSAPPQGDSAAVTEIARLLVAAENPVIVADRAARTRAGLASLVELAETLQAAVIDQGGRLNFPSRHPLNQSAQSRTTIGAADVVLGLELTDFWGTVNTYRDQLHRTARSILKPGARTLAITTRDLGIKANYQEFQRYPEIDLAVAGDAEATLPALVDAVKRLVTADRRRVIDERGKKLAAASRAALEKSRADAAYAWDASPVTTARLSLELWSAIQQEDWSLVSSLGSVSGWPMRLWNFDKPHQFIGGSGGAGVGYMAPASLGAALANRPHGRLTVTIQPDGDLLYAPGILWTAAHHRIPLLTVMHNNRAYHQELMHLQRMANRHNRGIDRAHIGTTIDEPNVDFAKVAQGMGVFAEGPIENPADLAPALKRAIAVVKRGEPALVDVVTQPR
ncbi:MAG: thiamine pyrophosphate-binding protein [Acidobacteria bacterium]|nr:MAG: thiamine pyrophosphate-binding protein [Acidobacteriota bacterium]